MFEENETFLVSPYLGFNTNNYHLTLTTFVVMGNVDKELSLVLWLVSSEIKQHMS